MYLMLLQIQDLNLKPEAILYQFIRSLLEMSN